MFTSLGSRAVEAVFRETDQDNDGLLTVDELYEAARRGGKQQPRRRVAAMLDKFDEDRDGRLNLSEFKKMMAYFDKGHNVTDELQLAWSLVEEAEDELERLKLQQATQRLSQEGGSLARQASEAAETVEAAETAAASVARLWRRSTRSVLLAADPIGSGGEELEVWTCAAWLSSLGVARQIAQSIADVEVGEQLARVRELSQRLTSESQVSSHLLESGVLERLAKPILASMQKMARPASTPPATESSASDKYATVEAAPGFELKYGDLSTFFGGLEGKIGAPDVQVWEAIRKEHQASTCICICTCTCTWGQHQASTRP